MIYLKIYRALIYLLWPFVGVYVALRKSKGKEDLQRFGERLGFPSYERPDGKLVWVHAASVGESLSMLPLINALLEKYKNTCVLITTGTVTSAALMSERLPKVRAFHQYVPLDNPVCVTRFLKHYRPDLALFCESEFWPNLMYETHLQNIPMLLINGHVSDATFKKKDKSGRFLKSIVSFFTLALAQSEENARRLRILGIKDVDCVGNLKMAADPPPVNTEEVKKLKEEIKSRRVILAASTHKGEEEKVLASYKIMKKKDKNVLLILLPRHPSRSKEIGDLLEKEKLAYAVRSKNETITDRTEVYLADRLGEMGTFLSLCPSVFLGGSLMPIGGHNILEPAMFGCYQAVGPYMHKTLGMLNEAKSFGAIVEVKDEKELADFFEQTADKGHANKSALKFAAASAKVLERVMAAIAKVTDKALKGRA